MLLSVPYTSQPNSQKWATTSDPIRPEDPVTSILFILVGILLLDTQLSFQATKQCHGSSAYVAETLGWIQISAGGEPMVQANRSSFRYTPSRIAKGIYRRVFGTPESRFDRFLRRAIGVIHVGANEGQERDTYARYGLPVIWIEPIPDVFAKLQRNIGSYPRQKAFRYLLTDKDDDVCMLHVASNLGASSSILELGAHPEIWPEIHYTNAIQLNSTTLATFIAAEGIDASAYDTLVLDTQGCELSIMKGGDLTQFRHIKTEAADFEVYKGCARRREIEDYLTQRGFVLRKALKFAERQDGSGVFDLLFERVPAVPRP
jgi:FkbM family methyltransferase